MNKTLILAVCALAVAFTACNNSKKTKQAGEKSRTYVEHLKNGEYDRFVDRMYFDSSMPASEVSRQKNAYKRILNEEIAPLYRQKGGIKAVNVISENISNDGQTATVEVENVFNNGQKERFTTDLIWVNNDWKIDMNKHRNVWRTTAADGRDITYTVKNYEDKDVFKRNVEDGENLTIKVKDEDNRQVVKVKDGDDKKVKKVIDKEDETVIKRKENGEKDVTTIEK